jgi:DNA-binding NtrC family response regulator
MNGIESKGRSPFYPDQPVPVEWFRGRKEQIQHILQRGVGQVAAGKPVTMFVEGEYGIGKSSIAAFAQWQAEMG